MWLWLLTGGEPRRSTRAVRSGSSCKTWRPTLPGCRGTWRAAMPRPRAAAVGHEGPSSGDLLKSLASQFEDYVRELGRLNLAYARGLQDLATTSSERLQDVVSGAATRAEHGRSSTSVRRAGPNSGPGAASSPQAASPPHAALALDGPIGGTASGAFTVANPREETVRLSFDAGLLTDRTGSSGEAGSDAMSSAEGFAPAFAFDPATLELAPGSESTVTVTLRLPARTFKAGRDYRGEVQVVGGDGAVLDVTVRPRTRSTPKPGGDEGDAKKARRRRRRRRRRLRRRRLRRRSRQRRSDQLVRRVHLVSKGEALAHQPRHMRAGHQPGQRARHRRARRSGGVAELRCLARGIPIPPAHRPGLVAGGQWWPARQPGQRLRCRSTEPGAVSRAGEMWSARAGQLRDQAVHRAPRAVLAPEQIALARYASLSEDHVPASRVADGDHVAAAGKRRAGRVQQIAHHDGVAGDQPPVRTTEDDGRAGSHQLDPSSLRCLCCRFLLLLLGVEIGRHPLGPDTVLSRRPVVARCSTRRSPTTT